MTPAEQRAQLDLVRRLNERHQEARPGDPQLEARIQSFELAYRMQSEAADAFDVNREPLQVRERYGPGVHGRQLLITRRLHRARRPVRAGLERGRPAVGQPRRHCEASTGSWPASGTSPIAAFLDDLKARGLFDETLVMWGGEFGRTPVAELPALSGRDHNHYGFSMWLAGGGVKGGHVHRGDRRVRLRGRRGQGPRPRPARHDPAPARLRPREADVPLRRPRLPADRRARPGRQGNARLTTRTRWRRECAGAPRGSPGSDRPMWTSRRRLRRSQAPASTG